MFFWRHGPVETDQDTLGAQVVKTWLPIEDWDYCGVLPIEEATLLELKLKWLHTTMVYT